MRRAYQLLFFLHLIVGISALIWGASAMVSPAKPFLKVSLEALHNIGLNNFFLLGLLIFLILGLGNLFSAVRLIFNFLPGLVMSFSSQGFISLIISAGLVFLLYSRYEIIYELDGFMLFYLMIGLVQLIILLVMSLWILFYPLIILVKVLKNPDDYR